MTTKAAPKRIGRPPKPPGEKMVLMPTYRLPPALAEKYTQLGGRDWLIKQLTKAKPSFPNANT
jgi:hypothetical protein